MKSHEAAVAEAITALTARLTSWAVEDATAKATTYVNDMLRNGWRPRAALPVETPPSTTRPLDPERVKAKASEARAALRPNTEETA